MYVRAELVRNSGRKKNSGMSSLTSVADSEDESHHVVSSLRNVLSAMSKLPPTHTHTHMCKIKQCSKKVGWLPRDAITTKILFNATSAYTYYHRHIGGAGKGISQ